MAAGMNERFDPVAIGALAIKTQASLDVLRDSVAQFPTFTEGYLKAIERLKW
jgi:hypothetical protein